MSKWHPITRRIRNKLSRNAWGLSEMQCKLIEEIATDMENKIKAEGIKEIGFLTHEHFSVPEGCYVIYPDDLDKLEKGDE